MAGITDQWRLPHTYNNLLARNGWDMLGNNVNTSQYKKNLKAILFHLGKDQMSDFLISTFEALNSKHIT